MIAASGRLTAAMSSASFIVRGRHRLVSGVTQDDPQRSQDLVLVVADEHARAGRPLMTASAHRTAPCAGRIGGRVHRGYLRRQRHGEARPLARQRLDGDRAAVALDEPLGDREAEPGTGPAIVAGGPGRAPPVEGLEDPLAVGGGDAGPLVDDADHDTRTDDGGVDRDRAAPRP